MALEDNLKKQLQDLQKPIPLLHHLFTNWYKLFYSVVCWVATILKTRYTAPGFWFAGLGLFEQAESMVSDPSDKQHLRSCITKAREHLHEVENQLGTDNRDNRGYLFEGHLTVNPEPPQPAWIAQSNLMSTVAALMAALSSQNAVENSNTSDRKYGHCYSRATEYVLTVKSLGAPTKEYGAAHCMA